MNRIGNNEEEEKHCWFSLLFLDCYSIYWISLPCAELNCTVHCVELHCTALHISNPLDWYILSPIYDLIWGLVSDITCTMTIIYLFIYLFCMLVTGDRLHINHDFLLIGSTIRKSWEIQCSVSCIYIYIYLYIYIVQEALDKAGYNHKLTYQQKEANTRTKTKRVRSKGASWFNPPFSQHVKTNVFSGKTISLSILGLKIFPMAQRPTFLKFLLILSISEEHIWRV